MSDVEKIKGFFSYFAEDYAGRCAHFVFDRCLKESYPEEESTGNKIMVADLMYERIADFGISKTEEYAHNAPLSDIFAEARASLGPEQTERIKRRAWRVNEIWNP